MQSHNVNHVPANPKVSEGDATPFRVIVGTRRKTKRADASWGYQKSDFDRQLSICWTVEPYALWKNLRGYRKFVVGDQILGAGEIVFVHNSEASNADALGEFTIQHQWVAQVLEIRAQDQFHVYLRVFWLYRPSDLPSELQACDPPHGLYELIPSNDMAIIDAMCVNGRVDGLQQDRDSRSLKSGNDENEQDFTWRRTYNVQTHKLSNAPLGSAH